MRAITIDPGVEGLGRPGGDARSRIPSEGAILVDGVALGICGTDAEIVHGDYGEAPPGAERLILGHESLGRVAEAPAGSGFAPGDLVVGIVRRPDPEPCASCAAGEWDFCRNGGYTERGHQGAARLRLRALADRAGVRRQARPGARAARRADGADHDRGQGVGADRPHRAAGDDRAAAACSSPARGRSGCWRRCSGQAARAGGPRAGPGDGRPEARAGPRPRRALLHRRRARPRPARRT